jgi:methyltransferase (TIGR00027 family)
MRQDYSRTAEGMALLRALEQQQPPVQRIIEDPYAQHFLFHRAYRWLATWRWANAMARAFVRWWAPGGLELLTIRPRLVDDLAVASVKQGVTQIVLLGAGFDTLAWRCQAELSGVTLFEVDHPATQIAKRTASERLGIPANLRFVAVDFETEDFVEKLRQAGFDAQRPSFIIWVGVSYYLTAAAVAQTLTRIAAISQPGTKLVWDYLLQEILDGTSPNKEALDKARRAAQLGEPWLFGLATEQVSPFLVQFGFRLCQDYSAEELHQQYCPQRQIPMSYVRIVVCARA